MFKGYSSVKLEVKLNAYMYIGTNSAFTYASHSQYNYSNTE